MLKYSNQVVGAIQKKLRRKEKKLVILFALVEAREEKRPTKRALNSCNDARINETFQDKVSPQSFCWNSCLALLSASKTFKYYALH